MMRRILFLFAALALAACDDDSGSDGSGGDGAGGAGGSASGGDGAGGGVGAGGTPGAGGMPGAGPIDEPGTYTFASRFLDGSSVSYSGQTRRHVLVSEMKAYIGGLTDESFTEPSAGDVKDAILFYFDFASFDLGDTEITITSHLPTKQATHGDLGGLADLRSKMPDQDAGWTGGVVGYGDGSMSPTQVFEDMAQKVEDLVVERVNVGVPLDPTGAEIDAPFVAPNGVDYQQLIQKYLSGAIFYSQGLDDYLDDDLEGKGLQSDNTEAVVKDGNTSPYTALEHVWDEGFGYFGAARNFDAYTDDEIALKGGRDEWQGAHDTDGDGMIDLKSEYVFGHAQNAGKRDRGSNSGTDFTQAAFDAFVRGRTLIVNAGGALDDDQMNALKAERDTLAKAWEDAIAATVVHYINDVLQDMGTFGTDDYSFRDHAKHWSELKGFALALQFNVNHSSWDAMLYGQMMDLLGDAPVLPDAGDEAIDAYRVALREARAIIGQAQGFAAEDLGDDNGEGGW